MPGCEPGILTAEQGSTGVVDNYRFSLLAWLASRRRAAVSRKKFQAPAKWIR